MELYHKKIEHEQKIKKYSKEKIINNNVRIIIYLFFYVDLLINIPFN